MPVTKTAKRALRSSKKKAVVNKIITNSLDFAIRTAKKKKTLDTIKRAISLVDRAAKKKVFHKNKSARIKSRLAKLLPRKVSRTSKKGKV